MSDVEVGTNTFLKRINEAQNEKDVENVYRAEFLRLLPSSSLTSPYNTDGVLKTESLYVLLEFKYDLDFKVRADLVKPLVQSLIYLRKFYIQEESIPTSLFVGDRNECFMLSTSKLLSYLTRSDIDWEVAPSTAWKTLPELYRELVLDVKISPYVLDVQERNFYFKNVIERLEALHTRDVVRVPITVHNVSGVFRSWEERVLTEKLESQDAVGAFISSVRGDALLDTKKNQLVVGTRRIGVNAAQHESFFSWFQETFNTLEQRNLTAIQDRLLDDEVRRRSGDFYTPTLWVDEAHKMLDAQLGPDWRSEYVVWDCSCGSGNLTRDYAFKELYLSTLYDSDVNTIKEMGYNPGAEIFQFDFLNDPLQGDGIYGPLIPSAPNVPARLEASLKEGKKFVFLINPPFGTAQEGHGAGVNKEGVSNTKVRDEMELGNAKQQLYAQFMFRISEIVRKYELKDSVLAIYSVPLFMSGPSFSKFRDYFYSKWKFQDGFIFRADEFNGTSNQWGCSFTLWQEGSEPKTSLDLKVKKKNDLGFIESTKTKTFYAPKILASEWAKAPTTMWRGKGVDTPQISSAVQIKQKGVGTYVEGQLGYQYNVANNIYKARQGTCIVSGAFSASHGITIFPCNYLRTVALFTARKTVALNWINQKDEYCAPDTTLEGYDQWNSDAIVFSLFHSSSQQSSLRRIEYKGKKWDIQNEFFWMSVEEMRELANKHGFNEMYNDTIQFNSDRYVYKELQNHTLSPDAQEILDMAKDLTRNAMTMRSTAYHSNPEMHLDAWDAGWYQLKKGILEPYIPEEYKEFSRKFLAFRDRMREGVFEYGFLKQ